MNPSTRTWIVAHDLSTYAEHAADAALDDLLDSRRGGRIVLVHVVEVFIPPAAFDFAALAPSFTMIEKETREQAARSIDRVCERLRKRQSLLFAGPPPVEVEAVVRFGAAAEGVIEEAEARHAERIIVGTHGRSGLNRLVLGSVAERISRRAHIPVVVVHGTRADGDVEEERAA